VATRCTELGSWPSQRFSKFGHGGPYRTDGGGKGPASGLTELIDFMALCSPNIHASRQHQRVFTRSLHSKWQSETPNPEGNDSGWLYAGRGQRHCGHGRTRIHTDKTKAFLIRVHPWPNCFLASSEAPSSPSRSDCGDKSSETLNALASHSLCSRLAGLSLPVSPTRVSALQTESLRHVELRRLEVRLRQLGFLTDGAAPERARFLFLTQRHECVS